MKNENIIVFLLDEYITITDLNVNDDPETGEGIIDLEWKCESNVNVSEMNSAVEKFIQEVISEAVREFDNTTILYKNN